jgi:hypothetical protein
MPYLGEFRVLPRFHVDQVIINALQLGEVEFERDDVEKVIDKV